MLLTILPEAEVLPTARTLMNQALAAVTSRLSETDILEMIAPIMSYRYRQLSWEEIRTMLDLDMEEPRAFREAREDEGRSLILYQLTQKFGELPESFQERINALSRERLRQLSGDLLNFTDLVDLVDLETWLAQLFGE
jgi:predicted transposase YdaD